MNVRRLMVVAWTLLLLCGTALAQPAADKGGKSLGVRTFQFKYKDADKAAAVIKPLMSSEGTLSIQPSANSLVVTDKPENLKAISNALAQFDAPAQQFRLSVRLVSAARVNGGGPGPRVPSELRDVADKLAMLRFNSFEDLGEADVVGREGDSGLVDMKSGYRAEFKFGEYDPASDTINVADFKLSKLQKDELSQLLKTTLNLKIGQTVILGASKVPQSTKALMIVVLAKR